MTLTMEPQSLVTNLIFTWGVCPTSRTIGSCVPRDQQIGRRCPSILPRWRFGAVCLLLKFMVQFSFRIERLVRQWQQQRNDIYWYSERGLSQRWWRCAELYLHARWSSYTHFKNGDGLAANEVPRKIDLKQVWLRVAPSFTRFEPMWLLLVGLHEGRNSSSSTRQQWRSEAFD